MLSTTASKYQFAPNGATTVFAFPAYFLDNSHLVVISTSALGVDTVKTLTTHYTVSGAGVEAGGAVTMLVAPAAGTRLTIKRVVPITQLIDYVPNDRFPAASHEEAIDRLSMVCQQLLEITGRCLQFPQGELAASSASLGNKTARASTLIGFDASGDLAII